MSWQKTEGHLLRAQGAARFGHALRAGAAVARYGGDEFLLLTPNVSLNTAARILERARHAVENATIHDRGALRDDDGPGGGRRAADQRVARGLLRRAQDALGIAKRFGGSCVRIAIDD